MSSNAEVCENCGRTIGKLEQPCVFEGHVVCAPCHQRLSDARRNATSFHAPSGTSDTQMPEARRGRAGADASAAGIAPPSLTVPPKIGDVPYAVLAIMASVFCAPVGLVLVWLRKSWSTRTKIAWTCMLGGLFILVPASSMFLSNPFLGKMEAEDREKQGKLVAIIKAGDQQWDTGSRSQAVDSYLSVLSAHFWRSDLVEARADIDRAYRRAIDWKVRTGGKEAIRDLVRSALRQGVVLTVDNPEAAAVIGEERQRMQREEEAERPQAAQRAAGQASDPKLAQVRLGMTPAQVEGILGVPDHIEKYGDASMMISRLKNNADPKLIGEILYYQYGPIPGTKVIFAKDGRPVGRVTLVVTEKDIVLGPD